MSNAEIDLFRSVRADRMRLDAFKGALDNLARNAVVKSIETSQRD